MSYFLDFAVIGLEPPSESTPKALIIGVVVGAVLLAVIVIAVVIVIAKRYFYFFFFFFSVLSRGLLYKAKERQAVFKRRITQIALSVNKMIETRDSCPC